MPLRIPSAFAVATLLAPCEGRRHSIAQAGSALGSASNDVAVQCFRAYVEVAPYASNLWPADLAQLEADCPSWADWVSTDGVTPNKVHALEHAVVLGQREGNASTDLAGSMPDAGVDIGAGFDSVAIPSGRSSGLHLLSIPTHFFSDCCGSSTGTNSLVQAIEAGETQLVCDTLRDSIQGAVSFAGEFAQIDLATAKGDTQGFSQCYHQFYDVEYMHLHTTASVKMVDPSDEAWIGVATFNACVCEPNSYGDAEPGRGHCPTAQPREAAYPGQAAESLCRNIAGIGGVAAATADAVCGACDTSA